MQIFIWAGIIGALILVTALGIWYCLWRNGQEEKKKIQVVFQGIPDNEYTNMNGELKTPRIPGFNQER
jgi:hypothetical protein